MKVILLILLSIAFINSQGGIFQKVLLNDSNALCLDGTPGAYYISIGKTPSKFMIYFEGGGWCGDKDLSSTIQNCYGRSKTDLGSSKNYSQTLTKSDGILSQNSQNNFASFTKIIFKYCDGSGHQGTRTNPIPYKDTLLYFRGNNITITTLNDLESKYGIFSKSEQVMVTGASAGGLATLLWTDYVRNKLHHNRIYAVPVQVFSQIHTAMSPNNANTSTPLPIYLNSLINKPMFPYYYVKQLSLHNLKIVCLHRIYINTSSHPFFQSNLFMILGLFIIFLESIVLKELLLQDVQPNKENTSNNIITILHQYYNQQPKKISMVVGHQFVQIMSICKEHFIALIIKYQCIPIIQLIMLLFHGLRKHQKVKNILMEVSGLIINPVLEQLRLEYLQIDYYQKQINYNTKYLKQGKLLGDRSSHCSFIFNSALNQFFDFGICGFFNCHTFQIIQFIRITIVLPQQSFDNSKRFLFNQIGWHS